MSTQIKEKTSKESYRQCVMRWSPGSDESPTPASDDEFPVVGGGSRSIYEYVAWIPTKMVKIGKHILIDGMPGRWKIIDAGDARPAYIVDAFVDNARKGFPSVTGHESEK